MKIKIVFLLAIVMCFAADLFAQKAGYTAMKDTTAFKKSAENTAKQFTSMQSDFVQEKYMSVLSDKMIYKGLFYFKKENSLRWEYTSPLAYVIVFNGGKIYIKDEGKVNKFDAKSNKMFESLNEMMLNSVRGNVIDHKNFIVKYYENDKTYCVESKPRKKQMQETMKSMDIIFDKKDFSVTAVRIYEPSGDYTYITFVNRKINVKIADNMFSVK